MSIVNVDKIWVKISKNFEMRTSGGGVVSDFGHPRTRGEGGSKKGKFFCGRPLWMVTRASTFYNAAKPDGTRVRYSNGRFVTKSLSW